MLSLFAKVNSADGKPHRSDAPPALSLMQLLFHHALPIFVSFLALFSFLLGVYSRIWEPSVMIITHTCLPAQKESLMSCKERYIFFSHFKVHLGLKRLFQMILGMDSRNRVLTNNYEAGLFWNLVTICKSHRKKNLKKFLWVSHPMNKWKYTHEYHWDMGDGEKKVVVSMARKWLFIYCS